MSFIVCSRQNVEQALFSLCLRLKIMALISFIVCSLKKHCKVLLRIVFVHINSPNPYIYRCKCLPYQKQYTFLTFLGKNRIEMKSATVIGGRLTIMSLHALCVFLCTPPFDCKMRTLIGRRPLLGKKSN